MSINIPSHYVMQFGTNVNLLLQQKGSKLRSLVTSGSYVGKQASPVDQIDKIEAQRVTSRFAPMGRVDAGVDRRWVYPVDYDLPQMIDTFDKLRLITDPESFYVTNAVYAMGRKMDYEIITAFQGAAKTGEQGATSTSFDSGNEIDVAVGGSNSRLNVQKLLAVREVARSKHIDFDEDPLFCGLTAKDESALLQEIQITSGEFNGNDKPVLRDGKLERFLGINFVYCELVETHAAGTNEVNVPVWAKSGMHLGVWQEVQASVSKRNDIQGEPMQAYVIGTFGATRLDEDKVFNIKSYRA
ncbi:phage capsid protein [Nitrosovibrio sp. Nv4]|uniref:phage capsid protein n=1 Tax=Nitrosovibrio sp. Nv4 TaxID=1945880 RepID=UPI000BC3EFC8|nr:phage capsid protein [Nitrosovibrio sp. Nv4]SOD41325.1 hypothetical protein SAMN06298226_1620 [Nitrosovibrio sp. Nv4]